MNLGDASSRAIDALLAAEARRAEANERDPDQTACPACAEKDVEIDRLDVALGTVHAEIARLRADRDMLRSERKGDVWIWQGDEHDHPESLTCPVLMHPEDVRKMATEIARLRGALTRIRDHTDYYGNLTDYVLSAIAGEALEEGK